ncbi:MAG: alpha/beta fold hydrolase [Cyanobacteria bacterium P01_G01_bin.49]
MTQQKFWVRRIGQQRYWFWRGWQIRYSFLFSGLKTVKNPKPPLILLHGFGAAIEHWRHNIPILAEDYQVYALDLLGFGGSNKAATNYSVYLWVEQIHDFWQTFIGQPVVLVGNSIGSLVCLTAATKYPEMVAGIAMLSLPDVSIRQEMISKFFRPVVNTIESLFTPPLLLKGLFNIIRRPQVIRPWIGIAYSDKSAITDELVDIITIPPQDKGAARAFCLLFEGVRKPAFAPAAKVVLPSLKIPILLVWGRQDRMVPFSLAAQFAQLNPKITLVELDKVGHCPHDECPDQFNGILLNWLKLVNG